jgi:hypothetical protein
MTEKRTLQPHRSRSAGKGQLKRTCRKIVTITMAMARGTATMLGLAVMLAMVVGVGSTALAAVPGDPLKLGRINTVDALTQLIGARNNALLRISNDSRGLDATALDLQVDPKRPPMKTNSLTKVKNLHADLLDGRSADQFANGIGGTAVDADHLDGKDSSAFAAGTNGKAKDAFNADFASFAGQVQLAQTATDANNLDGKDSTDFLPVDTYIDTADAVTGKGGGTMLVFIAAPCDPGDKILNAGGGANQEDDMIEERPTGANSWLVRIRDNGAPTTSTAVANCLDFPPRH